MNDWKEHIRIDPKICHGQPCIKGTRIMVWLVVECLANGDTEKEIQTAYPTLTKKDIRAALAYAAELTKERILPIKVGSLA